MVMTIRPTARALAALILVGAAGAFAAKEFVLPRASHARVYAAHDEHAQERVTVGAEPYDTADKRSIFVHRYDEHHLLPIFVVISNDGDQPIAMRELKVELIAGNRTKIEADDEDQIARRFGREAQRKPQSGPRVGIPLPIPRRQENPRKQMSALEQELDAAMFKARAVEPHGTQAGFFFFDVTGVSDALAGAHLNVSGLRTGEGAELFFFDVPLDNYLKTRH
jgi:hypothetical protein